jgi:hypothetical protein
MWGYAQTLIMYDIRAIQQIYEASFDAQSGNNNYTSSTTTGEMFIDGVGQGISGANRILEPFGMVMVLILMISLTIPPIYRSI